MIHFVVLLGFFRMVRSGIFVFLGGRGLQLLHLDLLRFVFMAILQLIFDLLLSLFIRWFTDRTLRSVHIQSRSRSI